MESFDHVFDKLCHQNHPYWPCLCVVMKMCDDLKRSGDDDSDWKRRSSILLLYFPDWRQYRGSGSPPSLLILDLVHLVSRALGKHLVLLRCYGAMFIFCRLEKQRKKLHKEYLLKDMKDEKDEKLEKVHVLAYFVE